MVRFAICNEIFESAPLSEACRESRAVGYTGIELAPFTIDPSEPSEIKRTIEESGLDYVGLHWLLVGPPGLHVTTPDDTIRNRSWEYVLSMVHLCSEIASGPSIIVFGSPKQRSTTGGSTREEAVGRFVEGLRSVASEAESREVKILVEALPSAQSDVVTSLAEAVNVVEQVNSPAVRSMFDTHNAVEETEPHAVLIERYFPYIEHVHVNEMDGRHPGTGDYDFGSILSTLERLNYKGWVSLEAFDFKPGGPRIARETLDHLRAVA